MASLSVRLTPGICRSRGNTKELESHMLIDTDVHEMMRSKADLAPYMASKWRRVLETYQFDRAPVAPNVGWYLSPPSSAARDEWSTGGGGGPFDGPGSSIELMRTHLFEGEGVSVAVLNGLFYPDVYDSHFEFAAAMAAAYNDWQAEHWLDQDERLYGSIHVVADDPRVAAAEIDRMSNHPKMAQVMLPTGSGRRYGAPEYRPIFEAAERHGLAVSFHQSLMTTPALGVPRYFFEWHLLAAPQAGMAHVVSLVSGGVFDQFPELRVNMLEAGFAWLPWFLGRMDENFKEFREEVPWVRQLPSEHVRRAVRFSTQPLGDLAPGDLNRLINDYQIDDLIMFSSDYPHYDADSSENALRGLSDESRRKISHANALEAYPRLDATVIAGLDRRSVAV